MYHSLFFIFGKNESCESLLSGVTRVWPMAQKSVLLQLGCLVGNREWCACLAAALRLDICDWSLKPSVISTSTVEDVVMLKQNKQVCYMIDSTPRSTRIGTSICSAIRHISTIQPPLLYSSVPSPSPRLRAYLCLIYEFISLLMDY